MTTSPETDRIIELTNKNIELNIEKNKPNIDKKSIDDIEKQIKKNTEQIESLKTTIEKRVVILDDPAPEKEYKVITEEKLKVVPIVKWTPGEKAQESVKNNTGIIIAIIIIVIFLVILVIPFLIIPIVWLLGSMASLPFAIYSEKDYEKKDFWRPFGHSLKYSWLYLYTFFKE